MWLFGDEPLETKPKTVILVLPRYNLNEGVPPEEANWMYRSGCIVGRGDDGNGLNYVTTDELVAGQLAEYRATSKNSTFQVLG
jgi:hypothetical protein